MKTYIVYCPDDGEELSNGREIVAYDYESAAEEWAERRDENGDYYLVSNYSEHMEICVVDPETKAKKTFQVYGEAVPTYYAREITGQSEPQS